MRFKQLEYFICLAEEKNYTHAAEKLFLSRQGLNRCISKLEAELNVPLLSYNENKVELTEQGKLFHEFSLGVMRDYNKFLKELNECIRKKENAISFVAPHGFFETVSMDMIFSFTNCRPSLQYTYQVTTDQDLKQTFLNGEFDFAFSTDPLRHKEFAYYSLFRNFRCFAVSKQHPLYDRRTICAEDLKNVKIAVFNKLFFDYPFLIQYCENAGFEPDILLHYDTSAMEQFARSGQGIELTIASISDHLDTETDLKKIYFAEKDLIASSYPVNVITVRDKPLKPVVTEIIHYMQDYCNRLVQAQDYYPFNHFSDPNCRS